MTVIRDLGFLAFEKAWKFQKELVERRISRQIEDTLLLCEHEPVYTFGRGCKEKDSQSLPFPGYRIERGGKVTYHGPGQLMLYFIFRLENPDVTGFLRRLEQGMIGFLQGFGLPARRVTGETGVWIGNRKVASIGIAVKRWVTYHGISLNVNPDLSCYAPIFPCGHPPDTMTSMQVELKRNLTVPDVKDRFSRYFWACYLAIMEGLCYNKVK